MPLEGVVGITEKDSWTATLDWPPAELRRAEEVCEVLAQGKANCITVLRLAELTILTDYLIICSGATTTQVRAIADRLMENLKARAVPLLHLEGHQEGLWIVADLGGIMVHVFEEQTREFYSLERLWGDAPRYLFET